MALPSKSGGAAAWRADEVIAGNSEALQALRELISFPILYSRESKIIGLKVHNSPSLSPSLFQTHTLEKCL